MNRLKDRQDKIRRIVMLEAKMEFIKKEIKQLRAELDQDTIHLMEVSIDDRVA